MLKLLLDENLPKKLKYRFGEGYEVVTVPEKGWNSLRNGELLQAMNQDGIEYLVTADKNLSYQQNYRKWNVKLIFLDRLIISMRWFFHLSKKSNCYLNKVLLRTTTGLIAKHAH